MHEIVIVKHWNMNKDTDLIEIHGFKTKIRKKTTYIDILHIISINDYELKSSYIDFKKRNIFVFQKRKH